MRRKSFFGLLSVIGVVVFVGALVTSGPREVDAQEEGAIEATVGAVVNAWNTRDVGISSRFGLSRALRRSSASASPISSSSLR
jgi:hypothetical protein